MPRGRVRAGRVRCLFIFSIFVGRVTITDGAWLRIVVYSVVRIYFDHRYFRYTEKRFRTRGKNSFWCDFYPG